MPGILLYLWTLQVNGRWGSPPRYCSKKIFSAKFSQYGYPIYFSHLLEYLRTCPAKGSSNTEAIIGFVTNHPCLEPYQDRMKQVMVLDNIIHRLSETELQNLIAALGTRKNWARKYLHGVPEMDGIYYFFNTVRADGTVDVNPLYEDNPMGSCRVPQLGTP